MYYDFLLWAPPVYLMTSLLYLSVFPENPHRSGPLRFFPIVAFGCYSALLLMHLFALLVEI